MKIKNMTGLFIAVVMAVAVIMSLAACGKSADSGGAEAETATEAASQEEAAEQPSEPVTGEAVSEDAATVSEDEPEEPLRVELVVGDKGYDKPELFTGT